MADYNLGRAHGVIEIENRGNGFRQTQQGFQQTSRSANSSRRDLDRYVGSLGNVSDSMQVFGRLGRSLKSLTRVSAKFSKTLVVRAAQIGAISALASGAAAATGSIIQLAAALAPAAGLLAAIPGAIAIAAAALGTLKLATVGVGDAMSAAISGDGAKFEKALEKLSPAARQVAREFRAIAPEFRAFQQAAQEGFFSQLTGSLGGFSNLLAKTAPFVRTLAEEMGKWARGLISFVTAERSIGQIQNILGLTRGSLRDLRGALQPVLKGFLDIAEVGAFFLRGMAPGMANVITKFGQFLSAAAESGRAMEWMETGLAVVKQLGTVLANVGGILKSVFTAAGQSGGNLLGTFGALTAELNKFLKTPAGQKALAGLFKGLAGIGKALGPVLTALVRGLGSIAPAVGRIAEAVGPVLVTAIDALAPALKALEPGITALINGLGGAFKALGPALVPLAQAISAIAIALAPILPALGTLIGKLLTALAQHITTMVSSGALSSLVQAIIQLGGALGKALLDALVEISPYLPDLVKAITELLVAIIPIIPEIIKLVIALAPAIPILTEMITLWSELATTTMPVFNAAIGTLVFLLGGLVQIVIWAWGYIANYIRDRINNLASAINWFSDLPYKFSVWFGKIRDTVISVFRNAPNWLYNAGRNIITGLINGVVSHLSRLWNIFTSITDRIPNIKGPKSVDLKLLTPNGKAIIQSLMSGLKAQIPALESMLGDIGTRVIPASVSASQTVSAMTSLVSATDSAGKPMTAEELVTAMKRAGVGEVYLDGEPLHRNMSARGGRDAHLRGRTTR